MYVFPDLTVSLIGMPYLVEDDLTLAYSQAMVWMTLSDVIWQLREYVAPATGEPEAWIFTVTGSVVAIKYIY